MAGILVHTGRLLGRGAPVVNWAHPLAQNLLACYVPANFPGANITNLARPGSGDLTTRTGTATGLALTQEGMGLSYTGTSAAEAYGVAPADWLKPSGQSLFVRFKRGGFAYTGGKTSYLIEVAITATPFNCFGIGVGMQGSSGNGQLGVLYQTTLGTYIGSVIPALNTMVSAGATFAAGGPAKLYVNGAQDTVGGTPPNVNITTYTPSPRIYLGEQNASDAVYATITVGYVWGRPLTAGEMRYLDANPYALLLWPSDRVAVTFKTLAGAPSGTVSEAASATDTETASMAYAASETEAASATDTESAAQGAAGSEIESASAADTTSASFSGSYSGSSSESGSASDTSSASQPSSFTGTIVEYADAQDHPLAFGRQVIRLLNSTGLTRHETILFTAPSGTVYSVSISEAASVVDASSALTGYLGNIAESGDAGDSSSGNNGEPFVFDIESATWQPNAFVVDTESASFIPAQPCYGCPNYDIASAFAHCCPGVIMDRDIESALLLAYQAGGCHPLDCSQILAIVLPLMPEGNPPQYVNGCPPNFPLDQPGATPLFLPALPPQPDFTAQAVGDAYLSATVAVFQKGLPRFEDSNPEPFDGWAIDNPGWYSGGG